MAILAKTDEKTMSVFDQIPEEFFPVPVPIQDSHAPALDITIDHLDGFFDLFVFAAELRALLGIKTIIKRPEGCLSRLGPNDLKCPVAVGDGVFTSIVDSRQILHPLGILLNDICQIENQEGKLLDPRGRHPAELLCQPCPQAFSF